MALVARDRAPEAQLAGAPAEDSSAFRLLRGVFEGFVLLVLLAAVERIFLARGTFGALDLHPFWIPVLLVATQHGLYAGVATAGLAAIMQDWPLRQPGQDIFDHYFEVARLPVQWLLVAMAIGVFRNSQLAAERRREREIAGLRAANGRLAAEIDRLDAELDAFELAVATGARPGARAGAEAMGREAAPADALAGPEGPLMRLAALRAADADSLDARFAEAAEALLGPSEARLIRLAPAGGLVEPARGGADEALIAAARAAGPMHLAADPETGRIAMAIPGFPDAAPIGLVAARPGPGLAAAPGLDEAMRLLTEAAGGALSRAHHGTRSAERRGIGA
jgi:hypothetical protein